MTEERTEYDVYAGMGDVKPQVTLRLSFCVQATRFLALLANPSFGLSLEWKCFELELCFTARCSD